jgi:uncharacterized membrane protein YdjX (TVP38/TMEM64 family)
VAAGSRKLDTSDKVRLIAPIVLYVILALVAWRLGYFREQKVAAAAGSVASNPWVGAVFVLIYAAIAALALPVSPLAYAAGAVFGFLRGFILVWLGSMIGAVAGYFLARGILAKPARRLLGRYNEKLHGLRHGNVFLTAFRLQLMPIVPFGAFNYAAAISKLPPVPFFAGTAVGVIPGTLMATFIGAQVIAGVHGGGKKPYALAAGVFLVLIALSFAPKAWEKLRTRGRSHH